MKMIQLTVGKFGMRDPKPLAQLTCEAFLFRDDEDEQPALEITIPYPS